MTESWDFSSELDDLIKPVAADASVKEAQRAARSAPTGAAGVKWDGNEGELNTGVLKGSVSRWDDLLRKWDLDPEEVEIIEPVIRNSWEGPDGEGGVITYNQFKAKLQKRKTSVSPHTLDIEQLIDEFKTHVPRPNEAPLGDFSYVHVTGDQQIGKYENVQGGIDTAIKRYLVSLDNGVARLDTLRSSGVSIGTIYLPDLGDCFRADTEIVTKAGIVKIGDIAGQFVDVKDTNGGWVNVQIKSYGLKPITEVTWRSRRASKTIGASNGHEWILHDGTRIRTEDLKPGMKVVKGYRRNGKLPVLSQVGVQAGFIYGDGTATGKGARAIFCGAKDEALLPWFSGVPISEPDGKNQRRTAARFPESWKSTPRLDEGNSYLYGWLAGYFAADGCVDSHGGARLSSASYTSLEFVRSVCAVLGIDTYPIREVTAKAVGRFNDSELYEISLVPKSIPDDFFLLPRHRERIEATRTQKKVPAFWIVESVKDTGRLEETFCTVVPTTGSFLLADGLPTSNCVENTKGYYPSQQSTVVYTLTEQIRLARRQQLAQIKAYADKASSIIKVLIPGNHDEVVHENHKNGTLPGDSWSVEIASQVHDILSENPDAYGHVKVVVPEAHRLTVTLDMSGTIVAMAHGHQFKSGNWKAWWKDQAFGNKNVGDASILLAGHLHHWISETEGSRTFFQVPSSDGGSHWWENATGSTGMPAMLTFVAGKDLNPYGWDHVKLI